MLQILNKSLITIKGVPAWIETQIMGKERRFIQIPFVHSSDGQDIQEEPFEFWPNDILNKKQIEMYIAIIEFRQVNGFYPTYTELVEKTGRAIATVQKRIRELEDKGIMTYEGGRKIIMKGEYYIPPLTYSYLKEKFPDELRRTEE